MIKLKQISSLEKVRLDDKLKFKEIKKASVFKGERFSYQIAVRSDAAVRTEIIIESPIKEFITVYNVRNAPMDMPTYSECEDTDYITKKPGLMPDILVPIEETGNRLSSCNCASSCIWLRVDVPETIAAGVYKITVKIAAAVPSPEGKKLESASKTMELEVLNEVIRHPGMPVTQWFHTDCIAKAYNVKIYSKAHWELIDKYMKTAVDIGINMILVPVITPPLDTAIGSERPNVQLVDIEKTPQGYKFGFDKLKKWISLCKKNGFKYYEIAHLFSQWGSKCAPNIYIKENGRLKHYFGWHTPANSEEYTEFLKCFVPAVVKLLKEEKIDSCSYFHISDEPSTDNIDTYERAYKMIRLLIGDIKTFDALSNYEFYEKGLVQCPVTAINHIEPFLEHNVGEQWAYYCCGQHTDVSNRFLAMPSYRNRIIGIQMYKFNIKGFLQWGYNYYNNCCSMYEINPYITSSGDFAYPSGDAYTVYPGKNGPLASLRALVFYDALQDISACRILEKYIGREAVIKMIEDEADMEIRFAKYPRNAEFLLKLREKINGEIKKYLK